MLTSLPQPPRLRPRLSELAEPVDGHPYRRGAEAVTADGRSLPLVSATLRGTARGGIARLVLEQRFENRLAETLHVTYRMPLPADGAVSGYAFVVADRTIVGRVQRKQEARERFERAVAAGHTAALLEQERADIFTQSIGNLPAGQALTARTVIDQQLTWLPEGEWELRFPTVIGPRYIGMADRPEDVRGTQIATAPGSVAARIRIAIAIRDELAAGRTPSSPSHALATGADGATELRDLAGARLDRDLVLRWPVAGPTTGVSLAVTRPERSDDCFGLVTIVPPIPTARPRALPRDLIVLIDTSGSMAGRPLDKAKQVVALLIESLDDSDRLELIEFSSEPHRYKPTPVAATRGEKQAAIRWLRGLSADGGTEMRAAVLTALRSLRPGAQRQVVIATDGYFGAEDRLVAALHAGLPGSCRLHFVGIGSSVNRSLATAMARAGRGAEVICDLDADAERAARRLLDRTRSPVLTDITLDGSAVLARAPEAVPDVYAGSPVIAAVKLGAGELVVRGQTADGDWERRLRVGMPRPGDGDPAIIALFGRERVADLEARTYGGEDHDAEIERIGLAFQIATRFTPFVAVDESRTVRPAVRHETVPQELPYGTTAAAFGLRPAADDGVPDAMLGELSTSRIGAGFPHALVEEDRGMPVDASEPHDDARMLEIDAIDAFDDDLDDDLDTESSRVVSFGDFEEDERELGDFEADEMGIGDPLSLGADPEAGALSTGGYAPASPGDGRARRSRPTEALPRVAYPPGSPPGESGRATGSPVTEPKLGAPGAPSGPPDHGADRLSRVQRMLKPRGLAHIVRRKPTMPTPISGGPPGPPATGPMKTMFQGPPTSGGTNRVLEQRSAGAGQPPASAPEAPASRSPVWIEPELSAHPARTGEPLRADLGVPGLPVRNARGWTARGPWPVLVAIFAVLAVLVALLWWLVG
jgi:Ca-activated chloride channel family protein